MTTTQMPSTDNPEPKNSRSFMQQLTTGTDWKSAALIPALAVLTALIIGVVIIMLTGSSFGDAMSAYWALLQGSVGSLKAISETLTAATPLILAGLSVAIAFRAGLFNIGTEGQLLMGGMFAVWAGFTFIGLPFYVHIPLALVAGVVGGAIWGFIPGFLKAKTGAHEVITTIMLNYIALRLVDFLLKTEIFQREGRNDPVSKTVEASAQLPLLLGWINPGLRVHLGLIVALAAAAFIHWLLFRTTTGFEFRAVGANLFGVVKSGAATEATIDLGMTVEGATWQAVGFEVLGTESVPLFQFFRLNVGATQRGILEREDIGAPVGGITILAGLMPVALGILTTSVTAKTAQIDYWAWGGRVAR